MNKLRLFPLANAHYIMIYLQVLRAKHCILSVLCNVWLSYVKAKIRQNLLLSGDYDATGNYKQAVKKTAV